METSLSVVWKELYTGYKGIRPLDRSALPKIVMKHFPFLALYFLIYKLGCLDGVVSKVSCRSNPLILHFFKNLDIYLTQWKDQLELISDNNYF